MSNTTDNVSPPTIRASDENNDSPVSQLELTVKHAELVSLLPYRGFTYFAQWEFPGDIGILRVQIGVVQPCELLRTCQLQPKTSAVL